MTTTGPHKGIPWVTGLFCMLFDFSLCFGPKQSQVGDLTSSYWLIYGGPTLLVCSWPAHSERLVDMSCPLIVSRTKPNHRGPSIHLALGNYPSGRENSDLHDFTEIPNQEQISQHRSAFICRRRITYLKDKEISWAIRANGLQ